MKTLVQIFNASDANVPTWTLLLSDCETRQVTEAALHALDAVPLESFCTGRFAVEFATYANDYCHVSLVGEDESLPLVERLHRVYLFEGDLYMSKFATQGRAVRHPMGGRTLLAKAPPKCCHACGRAL